MTIQVLSMQHANWLLSLPMSLTFDQAADLPNPVLVLMGLIPRWEQQIAEEEAARAR